MPSDVETYKFYISHVAPKVDAAVITLLLIYVKKILRLHRLDGAVGNNLSRLTL